MAGEYLDWIAAIPQDPRLAIEKRDGAGGRAGVDVPLVEGDVARVGPQLRNIDGMFVFSPDDDGKFNLFAPKLQFANLAQRGRPFWNDSFHHGAQAPQVAG